MMMTKVYFELDALLINKLISKAHYAFHLLCIICENKMLEKLK